MASSENITSLAPETLPADFSDWDSEASLSAVPDGKWEARLAAHPPGRDPKPPGQSVERPATWPAVAEKPRASGSAPPAATSVSRQKSKIELANASPSHASRTPESGPAAAETPAVASPLNAAPADGTRKLSVLTATLKPEAGAGLYQSFPSKNSAAAEVLKTPGRPGNKKWSVVAFAGAGPILLSLVLLPRFHPATKDVAKPSLGPLPAASAEKLHEDTPAPSAGEPSIRVEPRATTERRRTADRRPVRDEQEADAIPAPAEMMREQLTAPSRIPQDARKPAAVDERPPANLAVAGLSGLGGSGANNGIFDRHRQPVVRAAPSKPIAISSGVAVGMLIQKTPPIYPSIAKTARVSGTVELEAIISRTGTIKDLRVVNGPLLLRQAAIDAVRTWRYKPYMLNGQPIEVETRIGVVFAQSD